MKWLGVLLAIGLLAGRAGDQVAGVQAARLAGLTWLRAPLPPPETAALVAAPDPGVVCPRPAARLDRTLYDHLLGAGAAFSCGNRVDGLLHFPGTPANPLRPFDQLATQLRAARQEILLANMVWDSGDGAPGARLAGALADLRRHVQAHPHDYPQGMTVRILLGNSVRFDSLLDPTTNAFNAARDLLAAGLPLAGPPEGGWRLELANYRYAAPHSHMKLLVLDGQRVTAGGFNVSTLHLPASVPGGGDVQDLALQVSGPVAVQAAAAFRDTWRHSRPLVCRPGAQAATVRRDCRLDDQVHAEPWTPPVTRAVTRGPGGQARVYGLYRRSGYESGDGALRALFGAAQSRIDLLQSQVSGDLRCELSFTAPGGCPLRTRGLPVWQAVADAVRQRHVRVRLVLDPEPLLRFEALSLLGGLLSELRPLGLEDHLEVRWAAGRLHTKAALIDGAMTVVGSTNLHFSSFGARGLTEYDLATSDPGAVAAVQATFDRTWRQASPVRLPWWQRGVQLSGPGERRRP